MEITKTKEQPTQAAESADIKSTTSDRYVPLADTNTADVEKTKKADGLLQETANVENEAKNLVDRKDTEVEITTRDKMEFLEAVTTGSRYKSTAYLFGGRVKVRFRSRSVEETEAILSYMHRSGIGGDFVTKADVSDAALAALLVAQVDEIDGVEYTEMKKPLKYTETIDGIKEPGWIQDLEMWRRKPEYFVAALGDALVAFEAKYWEMVRASKDENFWSPGGSTEK